MAVATASHGLVLRFHQLVSLAVAPCGSRTSSQATLFGKSHLGRLRRSFLALFGLAPIGLEASAGTYMTPAFSLHLQFKQGRL